MANISEYKTEKRFYTTEDFSKPFTAEIEKVTIEPMDGGDKPVVWLKGHAKGIVSKGHRITTLATLCGSDDTDDMVGLKVRVKIDKVKRKTGGSVDSITFDLPEGDDIPF
jgi:hypothetical protein